MATRKKKTTRKASAVERLAVKELRWVCNPKKLAFDSTSEMEPISSVVGQDVALEAVSKSIRRNRAGLRDPKRPIGSFIFLGPTGVGKTEVARRLTEFLFGDCNLGRFGDRVVSSQ